MCLRRAFRAVRAGRAHGPRIRYALEDAAVVHVAIIRVHGGRLVGGRCVRPAPSRKAAPGCLRRGARVASFTRQGRRGRNTVAFGGIVNGRPLRPGGYELTASVADGARRMVFRIRG